MADETKQSRATTGKDSGGPPSPGFTSEVMSAVAGLLSGTRSFYIIFSLSLVTIVIASVVSLDAMRIGFHTAYNVTREIQWGLIISTYIFFVVTSTGLCIVSAIGHVFGMKDFMPIVNRAVFLSVVTIFAGFTVIFFDIENPIRMGIYQVISPNLASNLWWMGTLYGAYMIFMGIEFIFILLHKHKIAYYAALAGLISGIAAHSNLGAIFGMLTGREFWYGPYMPIYFIASAAMSGGAAIILFTVLGYKINNEVIDAPMKRALEAVSKLTALMIAVILFFTTWKIITGLVGTAGKKDVLMAMLTGPYALNFWGFEVLIGMVIPFALLLGSRFRNVKISFLASILMIIGIFIMRYDLVVLGQVVPAFQELGVIEARELHTYFPSFHEMMITVAGLGIVVAAFLLGERVFKGHKSGH